MNRASSALLSSVFIVRYTLPLLAVEPAAVLSLFRLMREWVHPAFQARRDEMHVLLMRLR